MASFESFFVTLEGWGMLDALLPFLLIFTVIFAILQKTKVIGEDKKNIHVMLALIIALLVVIPHVMEKTKNTSVDVVPIINNAIPHISVVIVAIVMMLILIGVFGQDVEFMKTSLAGWIAIGSFAAIIYIFGSAAGWFGELPNWLGWIKNNDETMTLILVILVFGIVIWMITKEPSDKKEKLGFGNVIKKIGDFAKK